MGFRVYGRIGKNFAYSSPINLPRGTWADALKIVKWFLKVCIFCFTFSTIDYWTNSSNIAGLLTIAIFFSIWYYRKVR